MKKQLLLTTSIVVSGMLSGQVAKTKVQEITSRIPASLANKTAIMYPRVLETGPSSIVKNQQPANSVMRTTAFTSRKIGETYYDLQSNSSVGDRIVVNADGSIAAVWTMEPTAGDGTFPNRGTGYAYFSGAPTNTWSPIPTARVEGTRVGWGNIVNTRTNKELILSHTANGLNISSRATKGTGTWTDNTTLIPNAITQGNFWPRMVNSGDTIYAVSITYPVANGGAVYMGLDGAVLFSRSLNGGATWDIVNQMPTGMTSAEFTGFSGDGYAMAAKGSTVVIVAGDATTDIVMVKSTDAGATWTPKTVYKHPIPLWNSTTTTSDIDADMVADTIETNDGSLAVALNSAGKAHVAYGRMRILVTTPSTSSRYTYFPFVDGLFTWDESMPTRLGGKTIGSYPLNIGIEDLYGDNNISFPPGATDLPFGRWQSSLTSYPSMAFDAADKLYLSYSSIVDSLASVLDNNKLVRHVYVVTSTDGGANFSTPCDIVGMPGGYAYEGMFASMAKRVDGNVHLVYQRDLAPGNGIPGSAASPNPDETINTGTANDIIYFKFPVAEIGTCKVDVGVKEQNSVVSGHKFYPNPAANNGTLEITLNDNSKMDISVMNAVGQVVYSTSLNGTAGFNKVDLNLSNLNSGIYFYQVKAGSSKTITNKFVIAK